MPNGSYHLFGNFIATFPLYKHLIKDRSKQEIGRDDLSEFLITIVVMLFVAKLPDKLEPATSWHHRRTLHSWMFGELISLILQK
jgi:transposase